MNENPEKQDPYFAYATEHPTGKSLDVNKPDSTLSRDIEIGADGPSKTPVQITVTHNGILDVVSPDNAEYNESGRFFMVVVGLKDGVNDFGLRVNSSTSPSDTWALTVGAVQEPKIEMLKDGTGREINETYTFSNTVTFSGIAKANERVELYDGQQSKGIAPTDNTGKWSITITGLPPTNNYSYFLIEGLYDNKPKSQTRALWFVPPFTQPLITAITNSNTGQSYPNGSTIPRPVLLKIQGTCRPFSYSARNMELTIVGSNGTRYYYYYISVPINSTTFSVSIQEVNIAMPCTFTVIDRDDMHGIIKPSPQWTLIQNW